jgi:uncharacterized protein YbaR (Trm112 family)
VLTIGTSIFEKSPKLINLRCPYCNSPLKALKIKTKNANKIFYSYCENCKIDIPIYPITNVKKNKLPTNDKH